MPLNRVFFVFYRLVEKYTSVRLESYILYSMFLLYYMIFFWKKAPSIKKIDIDKRELWESYRFKEISNLQDFEATIADCLSHGPINYENTMELSIRGYYVLNSNISCRLRVKIFLHLTFCANLICPDLYLKREGYKLRDRSNNHQFYVLYFNFNFLNFFYRIDTSRKLLNFLEIRIENGLLNEGSTYYHLGVVSCIHDLVSNSKITTQQLCQSPQLKNCVDGFIGQYQILANVNFGDRDGTFLIDKDISHKGTSEVKLDLMESVYVHRLEDDSYLFINNIHDSKFGTGGHFHDDYGHLVIEKDRSTIIYDVGIYKYKFEPFHCRREFHNLPYFVDTPGVEYKSKFVRSKNHETFCIVKKHYVVFVNNYKENSIRRYFLFKTQRIIDIAVGHGIVKNLFALNSDVVENNVLLDERLSFNFNWLSSETLSEGFYYPDYCKRQKCMYYKLEWSLPVGNKVRRLMRLKVNV